MSGRSWYHSAATCRSVPQHTENHETCGRAWHHSAATWRGFRQNDEDDECSGCAWRHSEEGRQHALYRGDVRWSSQNRNIISLLRTLHIPNLLCLSKPPSVITLGMRCNPLNPC